MTVVGSRRVLYIRDSLYYVVNNVLVQLGWMTPNPGVRKDVKFITEPLENREKIEPNIIGMSLEDVFSYEMETGSTLERDEWSVFFDVYAENEDVGQALANDIRDILRGKFASLGRDSTEFDVVDPSLATPSVIFTCDLVDIDIARKREWDRTYKKFWWTVGATILDDYYDDMN